MLSTMAAPGHREQASGTKDPNVVQYNSKKKRTKSYSVENLIYFLKNWDNSSGVLLLNKSIPLHVPATK